MAYTLDDIKRIRDGVKTKKGDGGMSSPSSDSADIERIKSIRDSVTPVRQRTVYDDYARMATQSTVENPSAPTYRYNSIDEYDKALSESPLNDRWSKERMGYTGKKAANAGINVFNHVANIGKYLNPSSYIQWAINGEMPNDQLSNIKYTPEEMAYEDLKTERNLYAAEHIYDERYKPVMNNADYKATVESMTDDDVYQWIKKHEFDTKDVSLTETYLLMTPEQKEVARYYMSKGEGEFQNYIRNMGAYVSKPYYEAVANDIKEYADSNGHDAVITAATTPLKQMGNFAPLEYAQSALYGTTPNPYGGISSIGNIAQEAQNYVAEDLTERYGDVAGKGYQIGTSMLDSFVGAKTFGKAYAPLMSGGVYNTTYKELTERGADSEEALYGALLAGGAEWAFETISLENLLKPKNPATFKQLLMEYAKQSGIEASEEYFTELANIMSEELVQGTHSDIQKMITKMRNDGKTEDEIKAEVSKYVTGRVGEAAIGGAISGGGLSMLMNTAYYADNVKVGKNTDRQALSDAISKLNPNSETYKKYNGKDLSSLKESEVGALVKDAYNEASKLDREKYRNALVNALEAEGFNEDDAAEYAEAIVAEKKSPVQKLMLKDNAIVENITRNVNNTVGMQMLVEADNNARQIARTVSDRTGIAKYLKKSDLKVGARTELNDEDVKVKDVIKDDDTIKVVTENGEVNPKELTLSANDAAMVVAASGMDNDVKRQAYIANYDGRQNVAEYTESFDTAYRYGRLGMSEEQLTEDLGNSIHLTAEQASNAFVKGQNEANTTTEKLEESFNDATKELKGFRKGKLTFDNVDVKSLNATQRGATTLAEMFNAMGLNVVLFNDSSDDSENGRYENGTVYINLSARYYKNAIKFDKGYVINTMAHELTHWMEDTAKTEFEALKKAIFDYYGEEKTKELIAKEQQRQKGLSDPAAESEVVARACEDMLSNADTLEKIMMGIDANTRKSIIDKFKEFFEKLGRFLKNVLSMPSNAEAARMLRENAEVFEQVRQQWIKTFTEAVNTVQKIEQAYDDVTEDYTEETHPKFSDKVTAESTEHLMAIHNIGEKQLLKTISMGGFACPSIAILKQYMPHNEFGDISIVFPKATINPKLRWNSIFSGDAYTPIFPTVEKKLSRDKQYAIEEKVRNLVGGDEMFRIIGSPSLDYDNMTDKLNRFETAADAYRYTDELKYAYLKDIGKDVSIPTKDYVYMPNEISNDAIGAIALVLGKDTVKEMYEGGSTWYNNHPEEVDKLRLRLNEAFIKEHNAEDYKSTSLKELYRNYFNDEDGKLSFRNYDTVVRAMYAMTTNGVKQVKDSVALKKMLDENVEQEAFDKWLNDLFEGVVEKEGFRNDVDLFTASGKRRSWEALHDEITLENVVKYMRKQEPSGIGMMGANIFGGATKKYASIEDMRKDIARLMLIAEDEMDKKRTEISNKTHDLIYEVVGNTGDAFSLSMRHDDVYKMFVEAIRKYRTVEGINSYLHKEGDGYYNITDDVAPKLLEIVKEIEQLPTGYFEAKPLRGVSLDEIAYVVIPDNSSEDLIKALDENGIQHYTYDHESEDNRVDVTNEHADVESGTLFSNKIWDDTENRGEVRFYSFAKQLSKPQRDIVQALVKNEIRAHKQNDEPLDFSGVCNTGKWVVFYESYDDINPEVVGIVPYRKVYEYAERNRAWFDSHIDVLINQEGYIRASSREDIIEFANRVGVRGFNSISHGTDYNKRRPIEEGTKFSGKVDSEGNELSEEQQKFFAESKIVDDNGNLLVVYHGTPFGTFTEFKKKSGVVNREHYGHWFSDSKKLAEQFKNSDGIMSWKDSINEKVYTGYIKATNPYILDAHGLAWNNLPLPTEIARWMWDKLSPSDKSLFQKMSPEKGTWERFDRATTDDIAEFAQRNGYDAAVIKNVKEYSEDSGTVVNNSVCIFNSNQFKDIDNTNPTTNPDIRYSLKDIGYHAGDLGKSESLGQQGFGRGTGHFGTGTYFVGDEAEISHGTYGKRPHETVDFSKYNLYKPYNYKTGMEVHNFLKYVDGGIKKEWLPALFEGKPSYIDRFKYFKSILDKDPEDFNPNWEDEHIKAWQTLADDNDIEYQDLQTYIDNEGFSDDDIGDAKSWYLDYLKEHIGGTIDELNEAYRAFEKRLFPLTLYRSFKGWEDALKKVVEYQKTAKSDDYRADSYATVFMKALGYEGIDVRGIKGLDDTEYGSVIYDLKGEDLERKKEIGTAKFSYKVDDDIADIIGLNKALEEQNKKLKADVDRLNKRLKLEKTITKGKVMKDSDLETVAGMLLREVKSKADKAEVIEGLRDVYGYILDKSNEGIVYDEMMSKAYDVAKLIMNEAKPAAIIDDYFKGIMEDIRRARVKLTPEQIQEAKYTYGDKWRNALMGRITTVNEGRSLDSYWQEWAEMYPNVFDVNTNPNDQLVELSQIYDDLKDASVTMQRFNTHADIMAMAEEVYDKFWNIRTETTTADKHDAEIKKLKFEHRKAMAEVKEQQSLLDDMYYGRKMAEYKRRDVKKDAEIVRLKKQYGKMIEKIRERSAKREADLKQFMKDRDARQKNNAERRKLISKITEVSEDLSKRLLKGEKGKKVPQALKAPLAELLTAIDYSSKQLLGINTIKKAGIETKRDIAMSALLNRVSLALQGFNDAKAEGDDAYDLAGLHLPPNYATDLQEIADTIATVEQTAEGSYVLQYMTAEQLDNLYKAIKAIRTAINNVNRIISTNNAHEVDYLGNEIMTYLDKLGQRKIDNKVTQFMEVANKTPYYFFKQMGRGGQELFGFLQNGWDKLADNVEVIKDFTRGKKKDGSDALYTSQEFEKWKNTVHEFDVLEAPTPDERAEGKEGRQRHITMTEAQIMALYCLSKREQAMGHISRDGIVIDEIKTKKKYGKHEIKKQDAVTLAPTDLGKILSVVTNDARMKQVADKIQEFMNTVCAEWGNEVTMKLYGTEEFTEKNYFPIHVNQEVLSSEAKNKSHSIYGMLNQSFTKPLNDKARNEINIADIFDVFNAHASDMAKYNALALPIMDVIKVWNYKENLDRGDNGQREVKAVKKSITKAIGKAGNSYISGLLRDLNGDAESGRYDKTSMRLVKNYKTAAVAANIQTALLQPLAYIRAGYMVNPKYLRKALTRKPKINECIKDLGVQKWKSMGFYDTNLTRGLDKIISNSDNLFDTIVDKSLWLTEKMDEVTWGYLYTAVELETKDKYPSLSGEKLKEQTIKRLRDVVYGTQVFDSTLARTAMMRSTSALVQMETSFGAEPILSVNMLMDAATEFNQEARRTDFATAVSKKGKLLARASAVYLVASVVESALRAALKRIRDYDDEDDTFEGLTSDILERTLEELDVLNKIPWVKEAMPYIRKFVYKKLGFEEMSKSIYADNSRMDTEVFATIDSAIKSIDKALEGENLTYKDVQKISQALSQTSGLPISNVIKEFKVVWNNTVGRITGNTIK